MKERLNRIVGHITLAATMACLHVGSLAAGTTVRLQRQRREGRDGGAVTLEQAIITAVVSAAAIALGVVIVNAINNHTANIR